MQSFLEQIVADHMTRDVKTVTRDVSIRELGALFEKDDFNAYPVEEGSQVVGLVSKFDYLAVSVRRSDGEPAKHDGTVAQTGTVSPSTRKNPLQIKRTRYPLCQTGPSLDTVYGAQPVSPNARPRPSRKARPRSDRRRCPNSSSFVSMDGECRMCFRKIIGFSRQT